MRAFIVDPDVMMKNLFQFLKSLLSFLKTGHWIKRLKQSFSEKYAKLLLNLELFNFMNALTVNISATLLGWFASALLNGGFPPLVLKKQFPADSLSPPFPCDWKHLEVKFWNMVDCFLLSACAANEIIFKTKFKKPSQIYLYRMVYSGASFPDYLPRIFLFRIPLWPLI